MDELGAGEPIDILLIEPNPGDVRLFTESFKDGKIVNTLHSVATGEEALQFLYQEGEHSVKPRPNLVVLEPNLPGDRGMEILSTLNNEPALADIPVIVLTSSEIGEEIVKSHGLEADAYLRKPIESAEFIEFVQSVERFWLAIFQQPPSCD